MRRRMGCIAAFLGLFYLVGFGLLGFGLRNAYRSTQAASWPTVPGKITELTLRKSSDSDGTTTYEVKVRYTYAVDGVAQEGSRLAFGYGASSGRDAHEEIQRKLQGAKAVVVRYDPRDPAVSCLSFGMHRSIQFVLVFSVLWLSFIFGFTVLWWLGTRPDSVLLDNLSLP